MKIIIGKIEGICNYIVAFTDTMKFVIRNDDGHAEKFCKMFRGARAFSLDLIMLQFSKSGMYVQGMEQSHVGLFEFTLSSDWFTVYNFNTKKDDTDIAISPTVFEKVLNCYQSGQEILMEYSGSPSVISIKFSGGDKSSYDKTFTIPLCTLPDDSKLTVPKVEFDVDLTMSTKKFHAIIDQLSMFGDEARFVFTESDVLMTSSSEGSKIQIKLDEDDESIEYAIVEDANISYILKSRFLKIAGGFTTLCSDVTLGVKEGVPFRLLFPLGNKSEVVMYLAPCISDD